MAEALADLFDHGDDFALCDRLFVRVCEVHGNGVDTSALTDEERTVYLVWGALGVISNGGFRYLFESSIRGDPHYALTRHAFEAIGCVEAVEAFAQALAAFPDGRPPANPAERLRAYGRRVPGFPSAPDRAFVAAQDRIQRCLANWARSRHRTLMHLA
jgi:hypothetical protein